LDLLRQQVDRAGSNRGRALLGAPVPASPGRSSMIAQLLAFAAVISWAVAPRLALPILRGLLLLYALGVGP
jgi:hypothetical protein